MGVMVAYIILRDNFVHGWNDGCCGTRGAGSSKTFIRISSP